MATWAAWLAGAWAAVRHPAEFWQQSSAKHLLETASYVAYTCISVNVFFLLQPLLRPVPPVVGDVAADRSRRRRQRRREGAGRRPLRLRRALSFSSDARPQPESMFLSKLPLELRREIYQLVLAGRNKHFVRLGSAEEDHDSDFVLNCSDYRTHDTSSLPPYRRSWRSHMLALPLTSHQVYCEAIDIVYQSAVFKVSRLFTLEDLQLTLMPRRFASIRSLELAYEFRCGLPLTRDTAIREDSDWEAFWDIIGTHMPGLRELRLDLFSFDIKALVDDGDRLVPPENERKWRWLRHMLQVSGLRRCNVRLHSAGRFNVIHVSSSPISFYMMMVIDSLERLISSSMVGKSLDQAVPLNLPNDKEVESIWETCRQLGDGRSGSIDG